mgnify:CR=1 FL=1
MGLFDRKQETPKTKLEEYLIDNDAKLRNDTKEYIKGIINKNVVNPFFTEELLIIVLDEFSYYYEEVTVDEYINDVKNCIIWEHLFLCKFIIILKYRIMQNSITFFIG